MREEPCSITSVRATLKFHGDDPRVDLTDLFVFASPQSPGNIASIFDLHPCMTSADFNPKAVYRLDIDNDGDVHAQTEVGYYAAGSEAREPEWVGEVLIEGTPVDLHTMAKPIQARSCWLFRVRSAIRSSPTRGRVPRLPVHGGRHVRRQEHPLDGAGGAQRHARSRSADRSPGNYQRAPQRYARAGRPHREPVVQFVLHRRAQERPQRRSADRRRRELPGAIRRFSRVVATHQSKRKTPSPPRSRTSSTMTAVGWRTSPTAGFSR
jgi:hypothetical protein